MKLNNAAIDIFIGQDSTTINIYDRDAGIEFLEVTLTPEQLSQALSRLSHTPCTVQVRGIDKIGKKQEMKPLEFPFAVKGNWMDRSDLAAKESQKYADDGWVSDGYFGSQGSFFKKDGQEWARTTQRRWVEIKNGRDGK